MNQQSEVNVALAKETALRELESELKAVSIINVSALSRLKKKFEAELIKTEAELKRGVNNQLNDISHSVTLLEETKSEMERVKQSLQLISSSCEEVKKAVPNFQDLKRSSIAKRNVSSVLEQLDLYSKIPAKAKRLVEDLEAYPTSYTLRSTFREWLGLCAWRDRVLSHIEACAMQARERENTLTRITKGEALSEEILKNVRNEKNKMDEEQMTSSIRYEGMLATLKDHFRDVYVLGDKIFDLCWEWLTRCVFLSQTNPADLVCVVEIIERYDASTIREKKSRGLIKETDDLDSFRVKRNECITRLNQIANEEANRKLPDTVSLPLNEFLKTTCLEDLKLIATLLSPCFPSSFEVVAIFRKWYEARLVRELTTHVHTFENVLRLYKVDKEKNEEELQASITDGLKMISWMTEYNETVSLFDSDAQPCILMERLCESIMQSYLNEVVILNLNTTVKRVVEENAVTVDDAHLSFMAAKDLFAAMRKEINNVGDSLRGKQMLKYFITLCEVVESFQTQHFEKIQKICSSNDKDEKTNEENVKILCAFVNDCETASDLCVSELLECCARFLDADGFLLANERIEIVRGKFLNNSFAADALVRFMFRGDLERLFTSIFFQRDWEEGLVECARIVADSLEDWFYHPEDGLNYLLMSDYFTSSVLHVCLVRVVSFYCESLLKWPCQFGSARRAASRMMEDHVIFTSFFGKNLELLRKASVVRNGEDLKKVLSIFECLAEILLGDEVSGSVDRLISYYGVNTAICFVKRFRQHQQLSNNERYMLNNRKIKDFDALKRRWRNFSTVQQIANLDVSFFKEEDALLPFDSASGNNAKKKLTFFSRFFSPTTKM